MNRAEWLESRRRGLGGTDAAAVLGLSRWSSPRDVYLAKIGQDPERPVTAPMRWGLALERAIADAYTEQTGRRVRSIGGIRRAHHVRTFPMIGSIDRLTAYLDGPVRVVELKTARSDAGFALRDGWRDVPPHLRIPPDYYVQVQHYIEVADVEFADVAVLFGGSDFRVMEIPRDRDFEADAMEELAAFWRDYVLAGIEPPVSAEDTEALKRRYPRDTGEERVATAEIALEVDRILGYDRAIEPLEREREEARNRVKDYLGTATRLVVGGADVTWKGYTKSTVGWQEVATVYGDALRQAAKDEADELEFGGKTFLSEEVRQLLTSIDTIPGLYTKETPVRPFRVVRREES